MSVLPLPFPWTEHLSPTGHAYYFNANTGESTYTRPVPALVVPEVEASPTVDSAPKKEKPLYKIPIPDTPWVRVKTTLGNVFFSHAETKESVWTIPEGIEEQADSMDWVSLEKEAAETKDAKRLKRDAEQENLKRKSPHTNGAANGGGVDDVQPEPKKKKRRKSEPTDEDQALRELTIQDPETVEGEGEPDEDEEDDGSAVFSNSEDEEAWHREMAEDMAKLAEEEAKAKADAEQKGVEEDSAVQDLDADGSKSKSFAVPNQVNLSPEEARTLFKTLLTEKDPSPLAPFTAVMPLLITDPRYVLLTSQSERETVFNEWCREVSRARRMAKKSETVTGDDNSSHGIEDDKAKARGAYEELLRKDVTSTRMTWDDFRRKFKKDRRFFAFGRDDREREKTFRAWLKQLGEKKRASAQKAESDFMTLLKEYASKIPITEDSIWPQVKKTSSLYGDPRYDNVGSSTRREELFATFLKALGSNKTDSSLPEGNLTGDEHALRDTDRQPKDEDKKERQARALAARTNAAQTEKEKVGKERERAQAALTAGEAEATLMTLYLDAVREPTARYEEYARDKFAQLPQFTSSPLPDNAKRAIFMRHVTHLGNKFRQQLHTLFEQSCPSLASKYEDLGPTVHKSLPAQKLGLDTDDRRLRREWDDWMSQRTVVAEREFQELLRENSFVEFWGKAKKLKDEKTDLKLDNPDDEDGGIGGVPADDTGTDKVDLHALAKTINSEEVERVLKSDKRYQVWDHEPELRESWVTDYLRNLQAPGKSVHIPSL